MSGPIAPVPVPAPVANLGTLESVCKPPKLVQTLFAIVTCLVVSLLAYFYRDDCHHIYTAYIVLIWTSFAVTVSGLLAFCCNNSANLGLFRLALIAVFSVSATLLVMTALEVRDADTKCSRMLTWPIVPIGLYALAASGYKLVQLNYVAPLELPAIGCSALCRSCCCCCRLRRKIDNAAAADGLDSTHSDAVELVPAGTDGDSDDRERRPESDIVIEMQPSSQRGRERRGGDSPPPYEDIRKFPQQVEF